MVQSGWRVDLNWYVLRVEPFLCYARLAPRTLLVIPMNRPVFISFFIYIYIFFAFFFFFPWNNIILSKWPTKCVSRNSDNREKKRWYEWQMNNRESVNWNITDENNRHLVRKGYQETDAMITDRFLFSFRFTGQYY